MFVELLINTFARSEGSVSRYMANICTYNPLYTNGIFLLV